MNKPELLCILGPTASGKTALSIALAKCVSGEIVSADSMQIYKGMDIATAKPDEREKDGVSHHMIDILEPDEEYSVKRYVEDASECIDGILGRGHVPIVCGGTGLYIDSLLKGRDFASIAEDPKLREALRKRAEKEGGASLLSELSRFDPESAARLHENDLKRIIRAIEVYRVSGTTITQYNESSKLKQPRYRALKLGIRFSDRKVLYDRINRRVDEMMQKGLLDEARRLYDDGKLKGTALQAIGYKELIRVFGGECTVAEAVDDIKQKTRRYAKRQMTWFSRDRDIKWLNLEKGEPFEQILLNSMECVAASGIKWL